MKYCASLRLREPPEVVQIWNVGDNATDFGVHKWTARSAAAVGEAYAKRGNAMAVDIEHGLAEPPNPANPPPVAGYAHLEIRAGVPFLRFEWSQIGAEQIRTGQRRYLSPEYLVDKNGEIIRLIRVSLVADPATHNARMLASARRVRASSGECMDPKLVEEALSALIGGDLEKAAELLKGLIAQAASGGAAAPMAPPPADAMVDAAAPAAPPAPPAAAPDAPKDEEEKVMAKAADPMEAVHARLDAIERDALLRAHGARLTEGQRIWASKQSAATVKGLIEASPEPSTAATTTKAATRGAGQGTQGSALKPEEKAAMDERMGLRRIAAGVRKVGNRQIFGVLTREDAQRVLASRSA